jgi:hypothetical protein
LRDGNFLTRNELGKHLGCRPAGQRLGSRSYRVVCRG